MSSDDLLRSGDLPEEEITRAENRWVLVVCAITVLIVATFAASAALFHDALPSSVETIQSDEIHQSGEFVESKCGNRNATGRFRRSQIGAAAVFVFSLDY